MARHLPFTETTKDQPSIVALLVRNLCSAWIHELQEYRKEEFKSLVDGLELDFCANKGQMASYILDFY